MLMNMNIENLFLFSTSCTERICKMRRVNFALALVVGALAMMALFASPGMGSELDFNFVGFTDTPADPSGGIVELSQQCAVKFKRARMCTSKEIVGTANFPKGGGADIRRMGARDLRRYQLQRPT